VERSDLNSLGHPIVRLFVGIWLLSVVVWKFADLESSAAVGSP